MQSTSDSVVSLFSGAGGCSLGFADVGLKPCVAADLDADACVTYSANIGTACDTMDLSTEIAVRHVVDRVGGRPPFIIVGGPPCQGFSTAGSRNSTDPRNQLIFNYLELICRLKPRWFVFENVEGLLTSNGGNDVARLANELRALGYVFRIDKVNFAGYGLPQTRKRVLIVGNCLGWHFEIPRPIYSYESGKAKSHSTRPRAPSLLDAIADLPNPSNVDRRIEYDSPCEPTVYAEQLRSPAGYVSHHFVPNRSDLATVARHLGPGQTMADLPTEMQHDSFRRRANRRVSDGTPTEKRGGAPAGFKRLHGGLNALTITSASPREFIHPSDDRALTLRECARLQSFPDSFEFSGSAMSIARQIGNAIPPLIGRLLGRTIMEADGRAGTGIPSGPNKTATGLFGFHLTDADGMSPALARTASALQAIMDQDYGLRLPRVAHA
jgi:DNA (cytosine-5)-methyltransferase 1